VSAVSPVRSIRWAGSGRRGLRIALLLAVCGAAGCSDAPAPEVPEAPQAAPHVARAPRPPAPPEPGRWRRIPARQLDPQRDAEQLALIEQLEAIGYASASTETAGPGGLVYVDPERSAPGYTFMTSGHAPEAFLVDPAGRIVHRWRRDYDDIWQAKRTNRRDDEAGFWRRARLLPNGHVLAIFDGIGIVEVDAGSRLVWARANGAHHDLDRDDAGRILVLTREAQMIPEVHPDVPVLEDFVEVLEPDGALVRRVSLLDAFERSAWASVARATYPRGGDLFHMNTLTWLDGQLADRLPAFRTGNVLVSSFPMHVIAVVDLDREEIVWLQRGQYRNQHDPQVLDDGNVLLFDNRGGNHDDVRASAVLELDPRTGEERWAYRAATAGDFYSATCGAVQRLPNGNTLITESDRGRAFEVTPDGTVVWDYRNPHRAGPDGRFIATLFEAWRLPPDFPIDWLEPASAP
jgi:hypothetical protein